ncbi:MAG TPA: DUF6526 family protein [Candidatus Koribacter sp.]|jgi:hypothetical protein
MSAPVPQSLQNHVRYDPLFHFVALPVFIFAFIWSIVHVVLHLNLQNLGLVLLLFAAAIAVVKARMYALKVQSRVIRLEERLRLHELLTEPLRSRIPELTENQLVALRFASDSECPALVEKVLASKLSNAYIKKAVVNWRADEWRV